MENWNYKINNGDQIDWNQTLITKFNQLNKNSDNRKLSIPIKFKNLIKSLYFYDEQSSMIAFKYEVLFTNEDNNIILVGDNKLEILNFDESN